MTPYDLVVWRVVLLSDMFTIINPFQCAFHWGSKNNTAAAADDGCGVEAPTLQLQTTDLVQMTGVANMANENESSEPYNPPTNMNKPYPSET
jgi:hypothetical protein